MKDPNLERKKLIDINGIIVMPVQRTMSLKRKKKLKILEIV